MKAMLRENFAQSHSKEASMKVEESKSTFHDTVNQSRCITSKSKQNLHASQINYITGTIKTQLL